MENCKSLKIGLFCLTFLLVSCSENGKPIDAQTRRAIDSISAIQIRAVRAQVDSLCQVQQKTVLPILVDSIKMERKREIEEALKGVPK